jgi:hypothetical protein
MIFNIPLRQLPMALAMSKLANLPEPPPDSGEAPPAEASSFTQRHPALHALGAAGGGALAFGGGIGAGYLGQMGIEKILGRQLTPGRVRMAGPILGAISALAYQQYKAKENEELRRALKAYQNRSGDVSSG